MRRAMIGAALIALGVLELGCATTCWRDDAGDPEPARFDRDQAVCRMEANRISATTGATPTGIVMAPEQFDLCMQARGYHKTRECGG